MEEHKEELATIESLDSGAVYTLALKTHIGMSIDTLRYFAGWADKIQVNYPASSFSSFIPHNFFLALYCAKLCHLTNLVVFHSVIEQYY